MPDLVTDMAKMINKVGNKTPNRAYVLRGLSAGKLRLGLNMNKQAEAATT
jgi:hypothetical protein